MVDPGKDPEVAATLAGICQGSGYQLPVTPDTDNMSTLSKQKAVNALGTVTITQVDSSGVPLEEWKLWNAFVTEADFGGTLAYGNEELTEITLKMRFDWAELNTSETGNAKILPTDKFFAISTES